MTVFDHRHGFRHGTAAEWATVNPTLEAFEPGFEADTGRMKIGDGVTAWNDLAGWISPDVQAALAAVQSGLRFTTATTVFTSNVASRSGLPTNDGVTLTGGQLALLVAQSTGSQDGLWEVHAGAWTRPEGYQTGHDAAGTYTYIEAGTTNKSSSWVVQGAGPYLIDTDATVWVQASGLGDITVTAPLAKAGNTLSIPVGTSAGTVAAGDDSRITGAVQAGSNPASGVSVTTSGLVVVTHTNVQAAIADLDAAHAKPMALTGATAATRYVGGTASGAPASGAFLAGDFVIDQGGKVWVCTVPGSPGTWVDTSGGGGGLTSVSGQLTTDMFIVSGATTVLTTPSLATGTWLINGHVTIKNNAATTQRVPVWVDVGTATATFTGAVEGEVFPTASGSAGDEIAVSVNALAAVTVAGTLTVKAFASGTTDIKALGVEIRTGARTALSGYTAVKIA